MRINPVKILNSAELREGDFNKSEPILMKGLAKNWPATQKWSMDYFLKNYPEIQISVSENKTYSGKPEPMSSRKLLSMKTIIETIQDVDAGKLTQESIRFYASAWQFQKPCPELDKDFHFPDFIADNLLPTLPKLFGISYRSLFFSHQFNISRLHADAVCTAVYFTVLYGKKTVRLISPLFKDKVKQNIDLFDEAVLKQVLSDGIPVYEATVESGDTLFMPSRWFHAVKSDVPAIALSELYVGKEEFVFFEDEITRQIGQALKVLSTQKRKILQETSFDKIREHYDYLLQCTDFINSQEVYTEFLEKDSQDRRQLLDSIKKN